MATGADDAEQVRDVIQEQRRRKHIVVVDSSQVFLEVIREFLEDEWYGVTTRTYVPDIFTQITGMTPNLIIVDLTIAEQAGWALLERLELESLTRNIPVIVTSTDAHLVERAQANQERYSGDCFLIKPFDLDVLLAGIKHLIGSA